MRIFKRLFPVLLVLVLLTSVASAQFSRSNQRQLVPNPMGNGTTVANLRHNTPSPPRLDFGAGTGDIADTLIARESGRGEIPFILQEQASPDVPLWKLFFTGGWLSLMPGSRMGIIF